MEELIMGMITTVKSIMTKDVISVTKSDFIKKAIDLMAKKNIGAVIVTENGKPVGLLTERDVMKKVCPERLCEKVRAEEIMSKPLITIEADASLGQAAMLMMKKDIRRLLVQEKGEVVGIITQKDVIRGTLESFMLLASI